MFRFNLSMLCLSFILLQNAVADETTGDPSPSAEGVQTRKLSLADCRNAVAVYLMETPPESKKEAFDRIWAGYPARTSVVAAAITSGIEGDLNRLQVSWRINGFSGENDQDRQILGELIVDGYLNSTGLLETQVQTLKDNLKIVSSSQPETPNVFSEPDGLSMSADQLLEILGYNGRQSLNGVPFPWTPKMCAELAVYSYKAGYCFDALAIANHGLRFGESPSLLYIRGVAELRAGDSAACLNTMRQLALAHPVSKKTHELANINDPVVVRFLIAFQVVRQRSDVTVSEVFGVR